MKQKIFILFFLSLSLAGCGSEEASQESLSRTGLQIFRRGESQPRSSLGGLHPEEVVELEARLGGAQTTVHWFTADAATGDFSSPGRLHLKRTGRFLIGALSADQSVYIPVEVQGPQPGGSPQPGTPSENPDPPEDPDSPEDSDPPVDTPPPSVPSDSFMDEVLSFLPGPNAGFGSPEFPQIVLGAPRGGGNLMGSTHVLSLGVGGEIILKSETPILNGAGKDFIVFENAFFAGGNPNAPFVELGRVSVSQNGVDFLSFTCQSANPVQFYPGCAGVHPVLANLELNDLDPTDPEEAGGDAFDLEDLGLSWALYIKIRDLSTAGAGVSAGFDLDAISIIHQ